MARALLIALAVLLVAGCGGEKTVEPTGPVVGTLPKAGKANPAAGKKVFADNGCSGCHTFQAAGATGSIGPDLDEVLKGKDADVHQGVDHRPERRDRAGLPAERHAPGLRIAADIAADQ